MQEAMCIASLPFFFFFLFPAWLEGGSGNKMEIAPALLVYTGEERERDM